MSNVKPVQKSSHATAGEKLAIRATVVNELIVHYADEFHARMAEAYEAAGLVYERPMTEEEKAAQTVKALVERYPSLKGMVAPVTPIERIVLDDEDDVSDVDLGIDPEFSRSSA
jgi:hypothetical protein